MYLRNQEEIRQSWDLSSPCMVSVVCATYNHEGYIRDALSGFLSQKTNFPFEVIVHDDASTDTTVSIVQEYSERYPEIIKTVFQNQNQYSKGGFKPSVYAAKYAKGKYIALCEGDDFWIADIKLQQQVERMESNPGLDFCFHSAFKIKNNELASEPSWDYQRDQVFSPDFILRNSLGSFAPTSSYVFRREVLDMLPDWFYQKAPVGDFFIEMYGARKGGAIYLHAPMSAYRVLTDGSWSATTRSDSKAFQIYAKSMIESVNLLEEDFPLTSDSFNWKRAWLYTYFSVHSLLSGCDEEYRNYIEKSVREKSFLSKKQVFAYVLRFWPGVARYSLKIILGR